MVEIWSSANMMKQRVIHTLQGSVTQLSFVADTDDILTSGRDGRLIRWSHTGSEALIAASEQPIDRFVHLSTIGSVIFATADGALWRIDQEGRKMLLKSPGSRINRMIAQADQSVVYCGHANGDVTAIDTHSWRSDTILQAAGAIAEISITADDRTIAIAANDEMIYVAARSASRSSLARPGG